MAISFIKPKNRVGGGKKLSQRREKPRDNRERWDIRIDSKLRTQAYIYKLSEVPIFREFISYKAIGGLLPGKEIREFF